MNACSESCCRLSSDGDPNDAADHKKTAMMSSVLIRGSEGLCPIETVLGHVIACFSLGKLYQMQSHRKTDVEITFTAWTRGSIINETLQGCKSFIHMASLLQHYLYHIDLPACQGTESEYEVLLKFLKLSDEIKGPVDAGVLATVTKWCMQLDEVAKQSVSETQQLLALNHINFLAPHLIQLPQEFSKLFQYYSKLTCSLCTAVRRSPTLCLVCGSLVSLHTTCCKQRPSNEGLSHAQQCGSGTAIYLSIDSSNIYIFRGERSCMWSSIYLDHYGEEDSGLRRGKPLVLNEARYSFLNNLWRNHSLDHTCKNLVMLNAF
ncbi:E3 ubiquitin-protein ligase UBR3-like [Anneissia japonica]|uniref:E3 ubiquitin-protein ligase UBR3-like n=1 Tax=Anneissia japonica TaxID=1529436 RepID=UPI0014256613|nr:E3 ubiquitin-protein ligase UBR3-like [Anneissia japonica]